MSIPYDPSESHPDFDHLLAPLEEIAHAINEESDDLSERIQVLEKSLNALNLGVEAWCEQPFHQDAVENEDGVEIGTASMTLGYWRFDSGWALAVSYVLIEDADPDVKKLTEAKRWVKVEAYGDIPELIGALTDAGTNALEKIRESKKAGQSRSYQRKLGGS